MPIEQHGAGWRVRIRWRGLLVLSVSVATEADAAETEEALRQLRAASRKDLLAAVQDDVSWLAEIVTQLRTTKASAITLDGLITARQQGAQTLGAATTAWLDWCRSGGESRRRGPYRPSTIAGYENALTAFAAFLPRGKDTPLDTITPALLNAWRKHLVGVKATTSTVNRDLAAVQALWSWMADPTKGNYPGIVPLRLPQLAERRSEARAKQREDIEKVMGHLSPRHWEVPFRVLIETGLRDGEMRFLRWQDIDWKRRVVAITGQTKTEASRRLVPLTAACEAAIKSLGVKTEGYLFPHLTKTRYAHALAWRRACALAGVKIRIHDLRHSFTVRLLQGGADVATTRDVLGHSSITTTDRYAREISTDQKLERARRAAEKAPDVPQSSPSDAAETA